MATFPPGERGKASQPLAWLWIYRTRVILNAWFLKKPDATAHPAKFPNALQNAIGKTVPLPAGLTSLMEAKETCHTIKAEPGGLEQFIKAQIHDR